MEENDADINALTHYGYTALDVAILLNCNETIADLRAKGWKTNKCKLEN